MTEYFRSLSLRLFQFVHVCVLEGWTEAYDHCWSAVHLFMLLPAAWGVCLQVS